MAGAEGICSAGDMPIEVITIGICIDVWKGGYVSGRTRGLHVVGICVL